MKSYTDLEQSKVLAKILPLESADYYHATDVNIVITEPYITYCGEERCIPAYKGAVPCWSLVALLGVLPTIYDEFEPQLHRFSYQYICTYEGEEDSSGLFSVADNPIDACYRMIIKLNELKML